MGYNHSTRLKEDIERVKTNEGSVASLRERRPGKKTNVEFREGITLVKRIFPSLN
jgi:hypothetical protein